jgi:tRNA threonylcarbamoyladenosine biosynthesis protein TsaE
VALLDGPLGAGKTVLAQGMLAGLGVDARVTSPTFTLINEYRGRLDVWHADLYRLGAPEEFEAIGGDELLATTTGVTVVEWADRLGGLAPGGCLRIALDYANPDAIDDGRRLRLAFRGERYRAAAAALGARHEANP